MTETKKPQLELCIGFLNFSGFTNIKVVNNMMAMSKPAVCAFASVQRLLCPEARNLIAQNAVDNNFKYLLFIDDDNIVDLQCYVKLKAAMESRDDIDIISAPYFKRQDKKEHIIMERCLLPGDVVFYKTVEELPTGDICEVDIVGMGCTLIKVSVLKDLFSKYKMPFEYTTELINGTIRKLGEDVSFCHRARVHGYHIWIHKDLNTGHIGNAKEYWFMDKGEFVIK